MIGFAALKLAVKATKLPIMPLLRSFARTWVFVTINMSLLRSLASRS